MRVGLFGGSFNPIHLGHLRSAEEVREALKLDLIYFIPAASPPHKAEGDLAPAEHRLAMVRLATKGNRHFMVSDIEVRRMGRSFTIETVRYFNSTLRQPAPLYLMMGMDQFNEFDTWREADELVRLCNLAVHTRLNEEQDGPSRISVATLDRFGYSRSDDHYVHPSGNTLSFVQTTFLPISATAIRHKLQQGESINYLVPGDVVDYIKRHALY
ncbi:MAG TPA: nicotinate-nucleotide adenylyltransferase [Candidatus Binataceae bacterium]|nr:nicotinate-nucleotide adenylyltransferase [Candidatus Binataceae bacterium]